MRLDDSIHMMLIEDDEVDIQDIQRILQLNKLTNPLHIAKNGLEALNKLLGGNGESKIVPLPRIVILDINMPKMNGLEFLKRIRANPELQSLLVFVLTSSDEEKDKVAAYKLNVAGYILKPLQCSQFKEAISVLNYYWAVLEFPR